MPVSPSLFLAALAGARRVSLGCAAAGVKHGQKTLKMRGKMRAAFTST